MGKYQPPGLCCLQVRSTSLAEQPSDRFLNIDESSSAAAESDYATLPKSDVIEGVAAGLNEPSDPDVDDDRSGHVAATEPEELVSRDSAQDRLTMSAASRTPAKRRAKFRQTRT